MKRANLLLVLLPLLVAVTPVLADGKFYGDEESIPPEIPYQRALLFFDGARETLLVQSKYRTSQGSAGNLGWVVPVPAVPELASVDPELSDRWFRTLERATSPKVTYVSDIVQAGFLLLVCGAAVLTLLACLVSLRVPMLRSVAQHRPALLIGSLLVLLPVLALLIYGRAYRLPGWAGLTLLFLGPVLAVLMIMVSLLASFADRLQYFREKRLILIPASLFALSVSAMLLLSGALSNGMPAGIGAGMVEVITAEQVGIYDVQVVRAGQAGDLIVWLNEGGFRFNAADQEVFDDYLSRGWVFVAARVNTEAEEPLPEALAAPLVMRFPAEAPVYPLALTSTAGYKTEIVLYVASHHRWSSQERLELQFAGDSDWRLAYPIQVAAWLRTGGREEDSGPLVDPQGFFDQGDLELPYLCKFKGTLSPAEMSEDLVFLRAENDRSYRKRIVHW